MGFSTSAYHFYGVHVPKSEWSEKWATAEAELLDPIIHAVKDLAPDVTHLTAGAYDEDMLFLCIHQHGVSVEVKLGTYRHVTVGNVRDLGWDAQLLAVADTMGYELTDWPGWITVPDVS